MWKNHLEKILQELNSLEDLPNSGILAGGSLANKFWEKVSNNKAIINDIDIFVFENIKPVEDAKLYPSWNPSGVGREHYTVVTEDKIDVKGDHNGYCENLNYSVTPKTYYRVLSTERKNLLNKISIESNVEDPQVIIDSFDLNCTQVAYDLRKGRLYYTENFVNFLNNGVIKIVNANTPSHSLIRLHAKKEALNATFDKEREFSYITAVHKHSLRKNVRYNFSEKYLEQVKKYYKEFNEYFFIDKVDAKFNPSLPNRLFTFSPSYENKKISNKIQHINTIGCLNFYYKNVYGDKELEKLWENIGLFWSANSEYLDGLTISDLKSMEKTIINIGKWINKIPMLKKSLFGLTINQQIKSLKLLKPYLMQNPQKVDVLKVSDIQLNFDTEDDVVEYFSIAQIKKRKELYQLKQNNSIDNNLLIF